MSILPLAVELNAVLESEAPAVLDMLSDFGKRLYFPKGIISQGAEAKAKADRFNATIGIATEGGVPMHLENFNELFAMDPGEVYPYAPTAGRPELRELWRAKQLEENPAMQDKVLGMPIVTSALTHGLGLVADLFINPGDPVVLPEHFWGNYNLTFGVRNQCEIETYPLYCEGGFNSSGLGQKLLEVGEKSSKAVVVLNFPNNPTGYTPTAEAAVEIREAIVAAAEAGLRQVVVCDDAYFGLFFDDSCLQESIFGYLANCHPNVLAIKLDGATKELFSWGFRVGCLSYAAGGSGDLDAVHTALEKKTMGSIRGGISNSPNTTQSAVARLLKNPATAAQRKEKRDILCARANRTREVLDNEKYSDAWDVYPFNSGYFMCVKLKGGVDAEELRVHLLDKYGVGVISSSSTDIRVAFSCLEEGQVEEVFDTLLEAWTDLAS